MVFSEELLNVYVLLLFRWRYDEVLVPHRPHSTGAVVFVELPGAKPKGKIRDSPRKKIVYEIVQGKNTKFHTILLFWGVVGDISLFVNILYIMRFYYIRKTHIIYYQLAVKNPLSITHLNIGPPQHKMNQKKKKNLRDSNFRREMVQIL